MPTFLRELRLAVRTLRRSPGYAGLAVLALALGIGANSSIFSVVHSVLLKPLGYADPERLVMVEHETSSPVAPATYLDWQRQAQSFSSLAMAQAWGVSLRGGERPEPLIGMRVSANLFSTLGVAAARGRTFAADEDQPGHEAVAVISDSLWQRAFGGAADVVGRKVDVDGAPYTVVGVMPEGFRFAPLWITDAEIWSPLVLGERKTDRNGQSLRVFGRLKPGVAVAQAQAEMATIMHALAEQYPDSSAKLGVAVTGLRDRAVGNVRQLLWILLGMVGFVLLIACANVANLMLARASGRRREMAVRLAMGATRWQLIRSALAESTVLAGLGGVIGVGLAYASVFALNLALPKGSLPRQQELAIDGWVLAFTALVSLGTGLAAGLLPAWQSARAEIGETLKDGGRGGSQGRATHRVRGVLAVAEIAMAFVLLTGAGLMLRSFVNVLSLDGGFRPEGLLSLQVSVTGTRQAEPARRVGYFREVMERVGATPGVQSVSAVNHAPITGDVWGTRFRVEGRPEPRAGEWPNAVYRVSWPGYFQTMGTPVLRGRDFTTGDTLQSPLVVLVNAAAARRYWPGEPVLGQRLSVGGKTFTVVGVVANVKQSDWQATSREELYFPVLQSEDYLTQKARHFEFLNLVVRTEGDPAERVGAIRQAIESVDAAVLVSNVIPMEQAIANNLWRQRLSLLLLGVFGALALALALTGVYGVIAQAAAQREQEFGIRVALGAQRRDVLGLSLRQGMTPVAIGIGAGLVLAVALSRVMTSMLFGVQANDAVTLGAVVAVIGVVGLLATLFPARRAARVDPLTALRHF